MQYRSSLGLNIKCSIGPSLGLNIKCSISPITYLTVPNPSHTIINNILASALLAADTPSAIYIRPDAIEKKYNVLESLYVHVHVLLIRISLSLLHVHVQCIYM